MRNKVVKEVTFAGLVAALYFVITMLSAPLSYGQVQCRLSEMLLYLCIHNRFAVWGYAIGCALANISSPLGIVDVVLGGVCNWVCGYLAYKSGGMIPAFLYGVFLNAAVVGLELWMFYGLPFFESAGFVAVGQMAALGMGMLIFYTVGNRLQRIINRYVKG